MSELAATSEIYLHLGWTPKTGQDHVIFTRTLISLLNRINADVALDTYTGCEFCQPDDPPAG